MYLLTCPDCNKPMIDGGRIRARIAPPAGGRDGRTPLRPEAGRVGVMRATGVPEGANGSGPTPPLPPLGSKGKVGTSGQLIAIACLVLLWAGLLALSRRARRLGRPLRIRHHRVPRRHGVGLQRRPRGGLLPRILVVVRVEIPHRDPARAGPPRRRDSSPGRAPARHQLRRRVVARGGAVGRFGDDGHRRTAGLPLKPALTLTIGVAAREPQRRMSTSATFGQISPTLCVR